MDPTSRKKQTTNKKCAENSKQTKMFGKCPQNQNKHIKCLGHEPKAKNKKDVTELHQTPKNDIPKIDPKSYNKKTDVQGAVSRSNKNKGSRNDPKKLTNNKL